MSTAGPATSPNAVAAAKTEFDPRRLYTALVLIPGLYAIIRYFPPVACTILAFVIAALAMAEFYRLCLGARANRLLMGIGFGTTAVWFAGFHLGGLSADALFLAVVLTLLIPLVSPAGTQHRITDSAVTVMGILYIGGAMSYLIRLRGFSGGEFLILFVLLATFASDTGAYYVGKTLGRHKLAPTISPKKTIEGLVGGLVLTVLAVYVAREWFPFWQLTLLDSIILGTVLTLAGLAGDLTESAVKRAVGVKDSGGLLPGHGGMLDRVDSLLFTAPAFYYYVWLSGVTAP